MSSSITAASTLSFSADRGHSSFGFAVRHMGVSTFRGSFADVDAGVVVGEDGALQVTGFADVASISVRSPADLRNHLLAEDFFDASRHPQMTFRSTDARPAADGRVTVQGDLTIRNVTRSITATGTWNGPVEDPFGGTRAALELTAVIDRRDYGMTWNVPLPKGGDALGTQVTITVHLELVAD